MFPHDHHYVLEDEKILANVRKSGWVLALTSAMMVVEIVAGYFTLADGWHMASHAGAMIISLVAYRLGRSHRLNQGLSFGEIDSPRGLYQRRHSRDDLARDGH